MGGLLFETFGRGVRHATRRERTFVGDEEEAGQEGEEERLEGPVDRRRRPRQGRPRHHPPPQPPNPHTPPTGSRAVGIRTIMVGILCRGADAPSFPTPPRSGGTGHCRREPPILTMVTVILTVVVGVLTGGEGPAGSSARRRWRATTGVSHVRTSGHRRPTIRSGAQGPP